MKVNRIKHLSSRSVAVLREEGFVGFIRGVKGYIINRRKLKHSFKDVLFINGCTLPHPERYRVDHQMEQLSANNMSSNKVYYERLTLDMLKYYRAFVFFRCPITPMIKEFIERAKSNNKAIFYDIDDLVIDKKYTSKIKYLKTMSKEELNLYNDGVKRMQEALTMCDYAITTTERLATELKNYVPEVYINRNTASEKMVELSLEAIGNRNKDENKVIMAYLSGSITHNDDFKIIMPVVKKIMKENDNLYLKVVGLLDIPDELLEYKDRILKAPFVNWKKLPEIIASIDINLAPLEKSIFNEAKSENKWVEAALCKVITVASNFGSFKNSIKDGETGLLCDSEKDWYEKLSKVIKDSEYRKRIAKNAFDVVIKKNVTTYTGFALSKFISSKLNKNICFVLPSTNVSGGVNVVIKHCNILKKVGYDVTIINMDKNTSNVVNSDGDINVISKHDTEFYATVDKMVATLWATLDFVGSYHNVRERIYLVQNFETNFSKYGDPNKGKANATYNSFIPLKYITISKWCQKWLKEDFERDCLYAPNGMKLSLFPYRKRNFSGKIKIVIEGNSEDYYKNVDESFKIVEKLDKNKYEIYYVSYQGKPKGWYHVDKFMHKVPLDVVGKIYQECDIMIKSSILESFSYPPLEMMATGGVCLLVPNGGNLEYLVDEENCLLYEQGNIEMALKQLERLVTDEKLREKLIKNGLKIAKDRSWEKIEKDIIKLYE